MSDFQDRIKRIDLSDNCACLLCPFSQKSFSLTFCQSFDLRSDWRGEEGGVGGEGERGEGLL